MNRTELIKQAIESAKCRIYKLNFDTNKELSAHHQKKAENQKELMEITVEALERMLYNNSEFGKWIPCSERFPCIGRKVLLQTKNRQMTVAFLDKKSSWYSDSGDGWCTDIDVEPIAWMPLPEAYRGE